MLNRIRAVLFDLDGTLIDSAPDLGAAADKLRLDRGLSSLPLDDYRPMAGAGARGMLGVAFGITPEHADFDALRIEFLRNYDQCLLERTAAFDGVADMLDWLKCKPMPWGIVTNKHARFTQPIATGMPVLEGASTVISGDTTAHAKPHPAPLIEAARQLGLDCRECLYVGDDERDIVAGRAAGMPTMAAAWGYLGDKPLATWGADVVAKHPRDVVSWLSTA